MHPRSPKSLEDIIGAGARIVEWMSSETADAYARNDLLRSAVERNFGIIGEALVRIERVDPETAVRIREHRKVSGFRNVLAHGYDTIDHELVWQFATERLPELLAIVQSLLAESEADFGDEMNRWRFPCDP